MSILVLTPPPQCIPCHPLGLVFSFLLYLLLEGSTQQTGLHWRPPYLYEEQKVPNVKFSLASSIYICTSKELQESLNSKTCVGLRVAAR